MIRKMTVTKSAFRKHLILFFVMILLPTLLLLTLQIYNKYQDAVRQNESISEDFLNQSSRNLQQLLDQLGQMSLQISLTPNVLEMLTRPFDLQAYQYAEIKGQLRSWMNSNALFESIYLDILQNGKVLTVNEGLYDKEDFYDQDFLRQVTGSDSGYPRPWVGLRERPGDPDKEVLSFVKPVPTTQKTALGYLVFNIHKDVFMSTLLNLNSQLPGPLIVADPGDRLVSATIEGLDLHKQFQKIMPGIVYTEVVPLAGTKYLLSGSKSTTNGWTLLHLNPVGSYTPVIMGAIRQAALIMLGVVAVGVGLSYLFASILYDPWRRLAAKLQGHVLGTPGESQDAYAVVNRAIHNLIATIRHNEPIVRNHVVHEWLHNHQPDDHDASRRFAEAGIHFVSPYHAVLVVADESGRDRESSAGHTLYLFSLAEGELNARFMAAGTILERGKFAFILNFDRGLFDGELMAELEDGCRTIQRLARSRLEAELYFFVSGIRPLELLAEAYEQVKRAMAYKAFLPQSAVCFAEETNESGHFQYPAAYQKKILNTILTGDRDRVEHYMTELFDRYLLSSGSPYPKLLQMIVMLMSHVLGSLVQEGYDIEPLMDQVDLLQLQQCQNQLELQGMLLRQIGQIIDYLETVREQAEDSSPWVRQAIEYMESHYASNISIADIASHIGISPSHLSRVFKAEVGKSPLEYLTERRLSMSKVLLRDKSKSLQQISQLIGYNDAHTFIRSFKKAEGTTPGEYRKKVMDLS
ncbi:AraC family transcriptional regulator [Paenibacillus sp. J2TS4]|uniref:AraC family transcriptional regulator n=1 Tax=Paenibacillus sp. J2TS4 TaxID=2807194 RepID=UPI001B265E1F|nr:AraC family transcriptional regulator [Paenibacillus sp. J2TS4]GIP31958.1 hypothetical protein J2TS4_11680 [Paenibacillus sp. J2TS4]